MYKESDTENVMAENSNPEQVLRNSFDDRSVVKVKQLVIIINRTLSLFPTTPQGLGTVITKQKEHNPMHNRPPSSAPPVSSDPSKGIAGPNKSNNKSAHANTPATPSLCSYLVLHMHIYIHRYISSLNNI